MSKTVQIGSIRMGQRKPLVLIAGPCVIEDRRETLKLARAIARLAHQNGMPYIFKASYDKANRTSVKSFRGLGMEEGLSILAEVRSKLEVPVLSDIHSVEEVKPAAEVLDVLQIPAFLCRQTDLLVAAGETGKVVNIKKGQFMAPEDIPQVIAKVESTGNKRITLTERGVSFGYRNLVSDFRSIPIMQQTGYPVVFDATHSVQQPGGLGHASGGRREFVPLLARCGVAAGCDAIFMEVHRRPDQSRSDGPNILPLSQLNALLKQLVQIRKIVSQR